MLPETCREIPVQAAAAGTANGADAHAAEHAVGLDVSGGHEAKTDDANFNHM